MSPVSVLLMASINTRISTHFLLISIKTILYTATIYTICMTVAAEIRSLQDELAREKNFSAEVRSQGARLISLSFYWLHALLLFYFYYLVT